MLCDGRNWRFYEQYLTICFLGELFRTRIPKTVKNDKEKGGSRKVKGKKKKNRKYCSAKETWNTF